MPFRGGLLLIGVGAALWAGCGDDETESSREKAVSGQEAVAGVGAVRPGLDEALSTYTSGDAQAADKLVGDAYLEHFELVEGPLEGKDAELNEKLEDSSGDLRSNPCPR